MIDLSQTPNMFRMVSGVDRRRQLDEADANALKLAEAKRAVANRNAMGTAVQSAGGDYTAGAKNYLTATGDVEGTMKLQDAGNTMQDRQRADAMKHVELITKLAPVFSQVVDQPSWDAARQAEAKLYQAYGDEPPARPERFEEAAPMLERLRGLRSQVAEGRTSGGKNYVVGPKGAVTFEPQPREPRAAPETWGPMTKEQRAQYGLQEGDTGQISSRGQAKIIRAKGASSPSAVDSKKDAARDYAKAAGFSPSQQEEIAAGVAAGLLKLQPDPAGGPAKLMGGNGPIEPPADASKIPVDQREAGRLYSNGKGGFARWTGQGWQPE